MPAAPHAAEARRKHRGAFYTPPEVTEYLIQWAIRDARDRVFEPSCGEAAFMLQAVSQLRALGARGSLSRQIHGAELHPPAAVAAFDALVARGVRPTIAIGDFFDFEFDRDYDAVVGNPPYVRYQTFAGDARLRARERALSAGVALTGLASSWAAFVVHSAELLSDEGRLGLVLPAELLTVNYAAAVRRFLMRRFARLRLVMFEERVFPGVLEEVVLLLAEGRGTTDAIDLGRATNLKDLADTRFTSWRPPNPEGKWTAGLIADEASAAYAGLLDGGSFVTLSSWGATDLGMVTGNNKFFTLSHQAVAELGIPEADLLRISPPGSRHLRGTVFRSRDWEALAADGARVFLFSPPREQPSTASMRYISRGEAEGVDAAYKCRVRKPWWRVPLVKVPDLFFAYMINEDMRFTTNDAQARFLNSLHGVFLTEDLRVLGREMLPLVSLNTATQLGAELVGRAYGGGLLKVEPREADSLPVPSPDLVRRAAPALRRARRQIDSALAAGDVTAATALVDEALLTRTLGLTAVDVERLRNAREALRGRRAARSAK